MLGVTKGAGAPVLFFPAWPMEGHFFPALSLLQHLSIGSCSSRGFPVLFSIGYDVLTPVSALLLQYLCSSHPILVLPSALGLILSSLSQALRVSCLDFCTVVSPMP